MRPSRGMGDISKSKMPKGMCGGGKMAKGGEVGLYANINAKKKRIAAGSGEKMRKVGAKGAPTKNAFVQSAKTARKKK